jgi:hypothetical protein
MTRLLAALVMSIAVLLPGCFTAGGAVLGASVAHANADDPEESFPMGESIVLGGVLGLAIDVALLSMAVSGAGAALDAEH